MSRGHVIAGGRTIDLNTDTAGERRDVVLARGEIAAKATGDENVLDASGCLVLPGFIDIHCHLVPTWGGPYGPAMVLKAGVTCALDCTGPLPELTQLVESLRTRLRYAVCQTLRMDTAGAPVREVRKTVAGILAGGALGMKIMGGHFPLTPEANRKVIQVCAEQQCLCTVHVGSTRTYSDIRGLEETLRFSRDIPLQIAHVNGYCRGYHGSPIEEAGIALGLLAQHRNATSDSYVFRWNALPLEREGGNFTSHATCFWLERLGYVPNVAGALAAWKDGRARLVMPGDGASVLTEYPANLPNPEEWLDRASGLSLPVNPVEAAVALAGARIPGTQQFVIPCLSTDGGGIPRNSMAPTAWAMVQLGVWSWHDVVAKTAAEPARILGLPERGRIRAGALGDLTVLDASTGSVVGTIVAGRPAFWRGQLYPLGEGESRDLCLTRSRLGQLSGGELPIQ